MWLSIVCAVSLLICIRVMDNFVLPKRLMGNRGRILSLFAILPPLIFYCSILSLSYRPLLSLAFCVATYGVVIVFNNAKVKTLNEPLVYSDFYLLREMIRHPHLYTKYIDVWKLLVTLVVGFGTIGMAFWFEPLIIPRMALVDYLPTAMFFGFLFGTIYMITNGLLQKPFRKILLSFGPTADVKENVSHLGLIVCLIFYFFLSGSDKVESVKKRRRAQGKGTGSTSQSKSDAGEGIGAQKLRDFPGKNLPDIVAVQAESFFDIRYIQSIAPQNVLKNFDDIKREASFFGRLNVPAWGANTMRTEFAFLSGLPQEALGFHRFNPYLDLGKQPFWTIAHNLRLMGYRTVCVHPFPASFFNRQKVFPNLGFDEFIDVKAFEKGDFYGPYVGDIALGRKITSLLETSNQPTFIFAITMENHGSWSEDRLKNEDESSLHPDNWPMGSYSLNHYISHMGNTDQMIGELHSYLKGTDKDSLFCLYGDHVPNLQQVFRDAGYEDPRTDYFIWKNFSKRNRNVDTSAETLGRLMFDVAFNDRKDTFPAELHQKIEKI